MNELEAYQNRKPADRTVVRAICVHDGKVLAVRRVKNGESYAVYPGGGMDEGETQEAAVEREVFEETGVTVRALRRVLEIPMTDEISAQNFWLCEYLSGEPYLDPNGEEARRNQPGINSYEPTWLTVEEAAGGMKPAIVADSGLLGAS